MALENVKQEIISYAESEAHKLLADARVQAKNEMERVHKLLDAYDTELQESLKKELDSLEKKYYAHMKLAAKKILLHRQKEFVDSIFQELCSNLQQLPKAEKKKLFVSLIAAAKKHCVMGKVYCAQCDVVLVRSLFSSVEPKEIIGGLIIENKDGTFLFDYSFDSIIALLKEQKLQEVTALLFNK